MRRIWIAIVAVVVLFVLMSQSVLAAPVYEEAAQGDGDVHFGPYELESGSRATGDLVVFGGPVVIREAAEFDGDLTVFGPMSLERDGLVDGQLVVMGTADIAGRVQGNVFTAGAIALRDTAYVDGDLSATGQINRSSEAVVTGSVQSVDGDEWDMPMPMPFFRPEVVQPERFNGTPRWVTFLWRVVRGVVSVVLMGLLALLIASLWPVHADRAGRAIEEAPLTSYGVGLLTLLLAGLAALLLTITICLSPFALVGVIIVALGLLLGWVALGTILGRRILTGVSNSSAPTPVASAVVGTVLITLIVALSQVLGPLHGLLLLLLGPLAAGAVVLTRFGTRPYATRGVSQPPAPYAPLVTPSVASRPSTVPAPQSPVEPDPVAPVVPVSVVEREPTVRVYTGDVTEQAVSEDDGDIEDDDRLG